MSHFDVAIVGTGFSGLGMAIQLRKAGRRSFVVLEKAGDVGGTWRENRYPGCACDVPSHLYSFSFEPNPRWTRMYAPQREILDYLRGCADKYGIRPHIRFHNEVLRAELDEAAALWRIETRGGEVTARHLVLGVGALSRPLIPKLKGAEKFEGAMFHSAAWDHAYDLAGKRVAVVGTGASAIQLVPEIVSHVARVDVYQRTPPWVLPHPDRSISRFERTLFRLAPLTQRAYRYSIYWQNEARALGFTVDPRLMAAARLLGEWNIRRQIREPRLRARVRPTYTPGCKRILMSNTYYRALARPNAELVTSGIAEVTPRAVVDASGVERPVDAIIYGTGFDVQGFLTPMRVVGRGGVELTERWRADGVEAYRGTTHSGFPNLYTIMGPNTGLGHNSMVFMIEAQVRYVLSCIDELERRGAKCADVTPMAQARYNAALAPRLAKAVWASGCRSWYLDGEGRNSTLWPGFTFEFWLATRRFDASHHVLDPAPTERHEGLRREASV
jgi:cation diffusion facilitator CzcD-associated flavoprotein CzcO